MNKSKGNAKNRNKEVAPDTHVRIATSSKNATWVASIAALFTVALSVITYLKPSVTQDLPKLDQSKPESESPLPLDVQKPVTFDPLSPKLQVVKTFRLRKDDHTSMQVGKCPNKPCVTVSLLDLDVKSEVPIANLMLEVAAINGGLYGPEPGRGTHVSFPLVKGCYMIVETSGHNVFLEVQDERVNTLRMWVAILDGSLDRGTVVFSPICPGDEKYLDFS